jgi:hypothetical protein
MAYCLVCTAKRFLSTFEKNTFANVPDLLNTMLENHREASRIACNSLNQHEEVCRLIENSPIWLKMLAREQILAENLDKYR